MTSPSWITPAGLLGTLTERVYVSYPIEATGDGISFSVISGSLPMGLRIENTSSSIVGVPNSVPVDTLSKFVIRAKNVDGISDRTFSFNVVGPSAPVWVTLAGALDLGPNGEQYAINKDFINYQLLADTDVLAVGNTLKYYIADGDGELPPGLTLGVDGKITGYIDDILALVIQPDTSNIVGGYDADPYSYYPYDYTAILENTSAFVRPSLTNKVYQFYVTVTDGIMSSKRLFSIDVVDPKSLPANVLPVPPSWVDSIGNTLPTIYDLGSVRANTSQILSLYEYDPYSLQSITLFDWDTIVVNPEIKMYTNSKLDSSFHPTVNLVGQTHLYYTGATDVPQVGMRIQLGEYVNSNNGSVTSIIHTVINVIQESVSSGMIILDNPLLSTLADSLPIYIGGASSHPNSIILDQQSGTLHGTIINQHLYGESYKFTVKMVKLDTTNGTPLYDAIGNLPARIVGKFNTVSTSSITALPSPMSYTGNTGDIVVICGSSVSGTAFQFKDAYVFTESDTWVYLGNIVENPQMFNLAVNGSIPNSITFVSTSSLGVLTPDQISELSIVATSSDTSLPLEYTLVSGQLPTGLTLNSDGTIQGMVSGSGQTYFDTVATSATFIGSIIDNVLTVDSLLSGSISANQMITELTGTYILSGTSTNWIVANDNMISTTTYVNNVPFQTFVPEVISVNTGTYHAITMGTPTEVDNNITTFDNNWYFTVRASDSYRLSSADKEFYITVYRDVIGNFTRMYLKPLLSSDQRLMYQQFTTNSTVFDPALIYRSTDPEFGIQHEIAMLLEPSIEDVSIDEYVPAIQQYFYRKSFWFGDVKSISATDSNGKVVYEMVYVDIIDDQMTPDGKTPIDAVSVNNMRFQIENIQLTGGSTIAVNERLEPRYMSTIDTSTGQRIGFIKAVPICYAIPGGSAKILSRIADVIAKGTFNFNFFHFDTDRVFINLNGVDQWLFDPANRK